MFVFCEVSSLLIYTWGIAVWGRIAEDMQTGVETPEYLFLTLAVLLCGTDQIA